jgi:hypothetical protein
VLLLGVPVIDAALLAASVADLRGGGEASWSHGLAALYLGFSVGYGHHLVRWADGHAAHRLGGGPPPPKPPKYGAARARHEWRLWGMTAVAAVVSLAVLEVMVRLIGDGADTGALRTWQWQALRIAGIHALVAATYTLWPRREPAG